MIFVRTSGLSLEICFLLTEVLHVNDSLELFFFFAEFARRDRVVFADVCPHFDCFRVDLLPMELLSHVEHRLIVVSVCGQVVVVEALQDLRAREVKLCQDVRCLKVHVEAVIL